MNIFDTVVLNTSFFQSEDTEVQYKSNGEDNCKNSDGWVIIFGVQNQNSKKLFRSFYY